jgi:hypothetical protein
MPPTARTRTLANGMVAPKIRTLVVTLGSRRTVSLRDSAFRETAAPSRTETGRVTRKARRPLVRRAWVGDADGAGDVRSPVGGPVPGEVARQSLVEPGGPDDGPDVHEGDADGDAPEVGGPQVAGGEHLREERDTDLKDETGVHHARALEDVADGLVAVVAHPGSPPYRRGRGSLATMWVRCGGGTYAV